MVNLYTGSILFQILMILMREVWSSPPITLEKDRSGVRIYQGYKKHNGQLLSASSFSFPDCLPASFSFRVVFLIPLVNPFSGSILFQILKILMRGVWSSPAIILRMDRSGERICQGYKKHNGFCQPVFQLYKLWLSPASSSFPNCLPASSSFSSFLQLPQLSPSFLQLLRASPSFRVMFFIPLWNPFSGSIHFQILKILMGESVARNLKFWKRIDPLNGFTRGIKTNSSGRHVTLDLLVLCNTLCFFIPLLNPFRGSIRPHKSVQASGGSFIPSRDFSKWIDPLYGFNMGMKKHNEHVTQYYVINLVFIPMINPFKGSILSQKHLCEGLAQEWESSEFWKGIDTLNGLSRGLKAMKIGFCQPVF